jgi:hypothetical protein
MAMTKEQGIKKRISKAEFHIRLHHDNPEIRKMFEETLLKLHLELELYYQQQKNKQL